MKQNSQTFSFFIFCCFYVLIFGSNTLMFFVSLRNSQQILIRDLDITIVHFGILKLTPYTFAQYLFIIACGCSLFGTVNSSATCNQVDGQCTCKNTTYTRTCGECKPGYIFPTSIAGECQPCICDLGGAINGNCNNEIGKFMNIFSGKVAEIYCFTWIKLIRNAKQKPWIYAHSREF